MKFPLLILTCLILTSCMNSRKAITSNSNAITEYSKQEKPSILKILEDNNRLPVTERIALYHQLKKESKRPHLIKNEAELNLYGYSLLWGEKFSEALEIFKLVVAEFPDSWNAYDSLGEAYLAIDDKENSLKNYEKSLVLNPENFYAKDNIKIIKEPGTKFLTPEEKFTKIYPKQAYHEDLDQLASKLLSTHPNALLFITEEDFHKLVESKKALVTDQTTYAEFRWHCNEIIASLNCSHTSMSDFFIENSMLPVALRFPIKVIYVDGHLHVLDPLESGLKIKDEIVSINNIPVADLIADIYRHIQSQGFSETPKTIAFNNWAGSMISYALNFPKTYTVEIKGKSSPITLTPLTSVSPSGGKYSTRTCDENLCLEHMNDLQASIMTISSFVYYRRQNYQEFVDFIDTSMAEISRKNIQHLIIDLRYNGGGAPEASIHLLKYLMKKPFTYYGRLAGMDGVNSAVTPEGSNKEVPFKNRYKGKLYFLIDGHGASTTGHFMSIAKSEKLGTIIGEELGSNQLCTAGGVACRLDNTRIDYYTADISCETYVTNLDVERGILPDHYVSQSLDDFLNKKDVVKDYALYLLKNAGD